jgi:hypothetical protein
MSVYDIYGNIITPHDINGVLCQAYDITGNLLTGDYNIYSSEYERNILLARDAWMEEAREDNSVVPIVVHADQHGRLTAKNSLFAYLSNAVPWTDASACIGLGDTTDYSETAFQNMVACLSVIPKNKQINIWGNHDTWYGSANNNILTEEHLTILNTYFDNSAYNGNHKFNDYGIECMIDEARKIKYVTFGGWEYDHDLGGYSHYNIGSDSMDYIIQMLSAQDDYDIVILTHVQPFAGQKASDWIHPPVEDGSSQGGGGGMTAGVGIVVSSLETTINQMLIDRKNKASGTVKDSYGNSHMYDFTGCNSDLLCCFAGHEHCDKYMWQNGNIPVYLFDAYAYDNHPVYFVNINRARGWMNIWKIDDVPTVYNYQIPFDKPTE